MGKLVVVEGLDGSGKATQTQLLAGRLTTAGQAVRMVSFPDYDSDSSALVKMYLSGAFGAEPGDVNAYAASAFYAVDRFASYRRKWGEDYTAGTLVLADRYTTSNAIHQCAKLPREEWPAFIDWLSDFEYQKLGIPAPDLVLCLDVEPEVSQQLMNRRYAEAGEKDIHEADLAYLKRCREAAYWCAGHLGWRLVVCTRGGAMRPIQDINDELYKMIQEDL